MMTTDQAILSPRAEFTLIGTVSAPLYLRTSARGTPFVRVHVKVMNPQGKSWTYTVLAFGGLAEKLASELREGCNVYLQGRLGNGRNMKTHSWELALIAEDLVAVEEPEPPSPETQAALEAADLDDFEF